MLIHLNQIEETLAEHMLGGEGTIYLRRFMDDAGKIMLVRVQPGCSIGMHTHETSSEVCYILSGRAKVLYDGKVLPLEPGVVHYCPKGHSHSVFNDGDEEMTMYCVVSNG